MRPIDADALIEHMRKAYNKRISDWDLISTVAVIGAEEDAEPIRHGHWIVIGKRTDCEYVLIFKCSCCHTPFIGMVDRYHYCPNCGAKIDEIEEGEVVVTKKEIERIKDCANFSKIDEVEE